MGGCHESGHRRHGVGRLEGPCGPKNASPLHATAGLHPQHPGNKRSLLHNKQEEWNGGPVIPSVLVPATALTTGGCNDAKLSTIFNLYPSMVSCS